MRNASIDVAAAAGLTWALILELSRHLIAESSAMRSGGPWQSTIGRDLSGATSGVGRFANW